MLNPQQTGWLRPQILALQITCGSLILGALGAAFVLFMVKANRQFNTDLDLFAGLGIALAVGCLITAMILPRTIQKGTAAKRADQVPSDGPEVQESTLRKLFEPYQNSTIMRFALLEAPVFANLLFWFMEGSVFNLAVAGFCLTLMVLAFPTTNRVLQSLEATLDDIRHS